MSVGAPLRRYGAFPVLALAGTVALEQGERLSLSQALDGIQDEDADVRPLDRAARPEGRIELDAVAHLRLSSQSRRIDENELAAVE